MEGVLIRVVPGVYREVLPANAGAIISRYEILGYVRKTRDMYTITPRILTSSFTGISGKRSSPTSR